MYFYSNYLELGMKNDEDEEEKSHLIEVNPVIEFEKLDKVLLAKCFGAVVGCYLIYGICHEAITRQTYGGERFSFTFWSMSIQMFGNFLFAFLQVLTLQKDSTPLRYYFLSALFFCGAVFGSNHALQYLSYPSQVVGKACKPIPVLIITGLVARKRHNLSKYFCVMLLVIGVSIFLYSPAEKKPIDESQAELFGHTLLLFSLACDGLCGGVQEKIRSSFHPSVQQMMMWTNLWSFVITFPLLIYTGQFQEAHSFIQRHPEIIPRICIFCIVSAIGQHFIFLTIKHFGPLTVSIFTTCRKFFTVLFSVIVFGNVLSNQQWIGALIVFTGLSLDIYFNF